MHAERTTEGHLTVAESEARRVIEQALAAGKRVWVSGDDPSGEALRGYVDELSELRVGWHVALHDETPGGPYEGRRVGLLLANLKELRVD